MPRRAPADWRACHLSLTGAAPRAVFEECGPYAATVPARFRCAARRSSRGRGSPPPRLAALGSPLLVAPSARRDSPALMGGDGTQARPASRARSRRRRGRGRRAVACRQDTTPAREPRRAGRRRGRAAARRRRTSPERGAERGATGRTGTGDPRPGAAARPRTSPSRRRDEQSEWRRGAEARRHGPPRGRGAGGGRPVQRCERRRTA